MINYDEVPTDASNICEPQDLIQQLLDDTKTTISLSGVREKIGHNTWKVSL